MDASRDPKHDSAPFVPARILQAWTGRHWRWWTLAAGAVLTGMLVVIAVLLALVSGADGASLTLLLLGLALVGTALVGAGALERLSARMIQGGLTRQPLPDQAPSGDQPATRAADRERRDRVTIRSGLMILPMLLVFLVLLFS
jgi:hypothetical protein